MKAWLSIICALVALPLVAWSSNCASGGCGARKTPRVAAGCAGGACAGGAALTQPAEDAAQPRYAEINTAALATLLDARINVVVLDARTGHWDDGRRIPGAKALAPDADEAAALEAIGSKDRLVVTYCANVECPASKHLSNRLLELGFKNVLKYPEGIDAWQAKGHDIEPATP